MRFDSLDQWLAWQETLHPNPIDLGLERVARVARALDCDRPAYAVVTVAGTNGKGSCVALTEAVLRAAGHRVGAFTSPHLLRYNERIRLDGREADDETLCRAFERIDQARGETTLTYFEFATLAAFLVFQDAQLDVAVLEVGMGGRLDATNILDPDVAVVTSVGLDHLQWLGPDREAVGREKAGIFRPDRPAVCADPAPPASLLDHAAALGTPLYRLDRDFGFTASGSAWTWWGPGPTRADLPLPSLPGTAALRNAAAALTALALLDRRLPVSDAAVIEGLRRAILPGRFEVQPGAVERILDVAHNPDAAAALAASLGARPVTGTTHAVIAMFADKDVAGVVRALQPVVEHWYAGQVEGARAMPAQELARRVNAISGRPCEAWPTVTGAYAAARAQARPGDRIVVLGSFYTVAEVSSQPI